MFQDLIVTMIMCSFFILGLNRPHVALALAAWVNIVKPQSTSYSFLSQQPLSQIAVIFFFVVFFANISRIKAPQSIAYHFLMLMFMFWCTIAHLNAQFPENSLFKYEIAIKTLLFAYFIPFVLIDKKKLEFFLWVIFLSFAHFVLVAGVKSLLSGGGYGISLVGTSGSFLYSEGSTLSTIAICIIPLALYLRSESELCNYFDKLKWFLLFIILCSLGVLIGTQARTGLVALATFLCFFFLETKHKIKFIMVAVLAGFIFMGVLVTDEWKQRMGTIKEVNTTETSAIGRLVVWRWTIGYASERPFFGGGFNSYHANAGKLYRYQSGEEDYIENTGGKAFHNILIEVLGETGYGGLLLFLAIIIHTLLLSKRTNVNEKTDLLRKALRVSLIIYLAGGMFIGVAFYPWMYYLYGIMVSSNSIHNSHIA